MFPRVPPHPSQPEGRMKSEKKKFLQRVSLPMALERKQPRQCLCYIRRWKENALSACLKILIFFFSILFHNNK